MGIAGSLLFIALGAVLAFAIEIESAGVLNINTVGWILMLLGLVGLVLQFLVWGPRRRQRVVVAEEAPREEGRGPHFRDPGPPL